MILITNVDKATVTDELLCRAISWTTCLARYVLDMSRPLRVQPSAHIPLPPCP
jgi:hypothetical protein